MGNIPLNGVDTDLDVCRNDVLYNNSQFYEKFMVSKTSDKQEIGMMYDVSIQLEISNNTNNTLVGSQPTNTISNSNKYTTNNQSLSPLNELQKGNDFQGTDSVGVSVNTAVCSGSQKVEKHKVTKKSDWRFLTDFSHIVI